jgi:hypothetical protein
MSFSLWKKKKIEVRSRRRRFSMQRMIIATSMMVASLATSQWLMGQSRQKQSASPGEYIEDIKKRPDLGAGYARIAKFKLGSRKTTYRIGEIISIDLAIINISDTPLFFHELSRPGLELDAHDEKGSQVSINPYTTALEGTSPQSYLQIEPGHLMVASFQLLAGCTGDLAAFLDQKYKVTLEEFGRREPVYFKRVFDDSLFVNWGQACFDVKTRGRYTIKAEQTNDTLLVSPKTPKVRTAVGTIHSSSLTLTIIE